MHLAKVIGRTTATVKHPALAGWRMLIVQPLLADRTNDAEPLIAIDDLGSSVGEVVIITSDGQAVQEAMGTRQTPVRWMVIAQPDQS